MSDEQMILVEDASLNTVAIEVKVLRIGKRQMTQAVFRQLPHADVIDEDGNLRGTPWGYVNYHTPQTCPDWHHLHVIWESGGRLWRDAVASDPSYYLLRRFAGTLYNPPQPTKTYEDNYRASYERLAALDQLFIAV